MGRKTTILPLWFVPGVIIAYSKGFYYVPEHGKKWQLHLGKNPAIPFIFFQLQNGFAILK